jgi:hypothetical protein
VPAYIGYENRAVIDILLQAHGYTATYKTTVLSTQELPKEVCSPESRWASGEHDKAAILYRRVKDARTA